MSLNEQDVLITGHQGFIGKQLLNRLPNARVLDRASHDLTVPDTLADVLSGIRVIFHLAGVNAGSGYAPPNEEMARNNVMATYGLVQAIKHYAAPAPLVVMLSSIHVYRRCDYYTEGTEAAPASYYGLTKLAQELLLQTAADNNVLRTLILRASNVYGPGCRPNYNSAVATFCHKINLGEPIDLMGNGESQADLIYVDDVVNVLLRAPDLARDKISLYNLGSGQSTPVKDIVRQLAVVARRSPDIRLLDSPRLCFEVDNARLLVALKGFEFTPLNEGLAHTYRDSLMAVPEAG